MTRHPTIFVRSCMFLSCTALAVSGPGFAEQLPSHDRMGAVSQAQAPTTVPASRPAIYDVTADAGAQVASALAVAERENQRVLLMFGGNWCGWCHKLYGLFKEDKDVARTLQYEYQLVLIDVGRFDKHLDLAAGYGADLKKAGVPFLTVLDAEGKVLTNQETGSLEEGEAHDQQKVLAFLNKWKAEPRDAETVLTDGLARAAAERKLVFFRLGAPRCPWCRKLDEFLASREVAQILALDFVEVKIDIDRMKNGKEVAGRFRPSDKTGIPWFAVLDAGGKILATSEGPEGNIGFPVQPAEINHFVGMLKKTSRHISAEQVQQIEKLLRASSESVPENTPDRQSPATPACPGEAGGGSESS